MIVSRIDINGIFDIKVSQNKTILGVVLQENSAIQAKVRNLQSLRLYWKIYGTGVGAGIAPPGIAGA